MDRPFTPPPRHLDQPMDITPLQLINPSPRPSLSTSLSDFSLPHHHPASAPPSPSGGTSHLSLLNDPLVSNSPGGPNAACGNPLGNSYLNSPGAATSQTPQYPLLRRLRRPSLLGLVVDRTTAHGSITGPLKGSSNGSNTSGGPLSQSPLSMSLFERRLAASGGNVVISGKSNSNGNGNGNNSGSSNDINTSNTPDLPMSTSSSGGTPVTSSSNSSSRMQSPPLLPSAVTDSVEPKSAPHTPNLARRTFGGGAGPVVSSPMGFEIGNEPRTPLSARRASFPLRFPRVNTLLSESTTPISLSETRSEAQFQRLLASNSELPINLHGHSKKAPRTWSVTGRYPESVGGDDPVDLDEWSEGSEPEVIDDATNGTGSIDINMNTCLSGRASPAGSMMDVDMSAFGYGSPQSSSSTQAISWREPTPAASTSKKRKFTDDRYDPYPMPASKRRAGSPMMSQFGHQVGAGSFPTPYPIAIPRSPIIPNHRPGSSGSLSSSPVLRPMSSSAMMLSSSPVLRPIQRMFGSISREGEREVREVEGANQGVNGLTLA